MLAKVEHIDYVNAKLASRISLLYRVPEDCPVAQCLKRTTGRKAHVDYKSFYFLDEPKQKYALCDVARRIIGIWGTDPRYTRLYHEFTYEPMALHS